VLPTSQDGISSNGSQYASTLDGNGNAASTDATCRKDPWMHACTTLMAIFLLTSMTMLMVVKIPLAAPLLPPSFLQLQTLKFHK